MLTRQVCYFSIKGYQPSHTKATSLCVFTFNENLEIFLYYCITIELYLMLQRVTQPILSSFKDGPIVFLI